MSDSEDYPRCTYCGRKILWVNRRAYDAELPEGLSPEARMDLMGKLVPHRCQEYHARKAERP